MSSISLVALTVVALGSGATADDSTVDPGIAASVSEVPHRLQVELIDGSILNGWTPIARLPMKTRLGDLRIPLETLRTLERGAGAGSFIAHLHDGDRITGTPADDLELDGILGRLVLRFAQIRRITVRGVVGQLPADGLVLRHMLRPYSPIEMRGRVPDLSGNGREGRYSGPDRCETFEASAVEHPFDASSPLFPIDRPFTVTATLRTHATEPGEMMLISNHFAGAGTDGFWLMVDTQQHGGRARFFVGPHHTEIVGETPLNDGQWHQIIASWDGQKMWLYVDGELEAEAETSDPLIYTQSVPLRIGHSASNVSSSKQPEKYHFRGEIGEIRMYDRALSESEFCPVLQQALGQNPRH